MKGKSLMVQGTASGVGKSVLCTALLRILKQDGWRAAPFKAQNMALNSFVTRDGLEMGRAQVTQAQAAGLEPDIRMNPVLLKPTGDRRSQIIVEGRSVGNMTAMEYHLMKPALRRRIREIYESLESEMDFVILEGAGSPAEINLREGDIVNMSMAETADAPVLLVGDIEPGGVFASLLGTVMLLTGEERKRVKGLIINKFRGDLKLLEPGLPMIEERTGIPVLGVIPWMDIQLEDEDSMTRRFRQVSGTGEVSVAVVLLNHISNFTDFQALALSPEVCLRYVRDPEALRDADLVILPGSKNTMEDLAALRETGMTDAVLAHAQSGGLVLGICGGYQMLGKALHDPEHTESDLPDLPGLGLLDMETTFLPEKRTVQSRGTVWTTGGWLSAANGLRTEGYEIHAGRCTFGPDAVPWLEISGRTDGIRNPDGNVLGTHLHGLFDSGVLFPHFLKELRRRKGLTEKSAPAPDPASPDPSHPVLSMDEFREREFDRVAAVVRGSLNMDAVCRILRGEA